MDSEQLSTYGANCRLVSHLSWEYDGEGESVGTEAFDHTHSAWTELLKEHVVNGRVGYAGIHATGQQALDAYLSELESVTKSQYRGWTKKQKMAFGINAYNAYTIRLVLNHYPIKSMRKIGLLPGAAWREKFIPLGKIFDWYEDDFTAEAATVAEYVAKYMDGDVGAAVAAGNVKVEHLSYNWSLNGK